MSFYKNLDYLEVQSAGNFFRAGKRGESIEVVRDYSTKGSPHALASLTWFLLLEDKFDEAVKDFEEFSPLIDTYIQREKDKLNKKWLTNLEKIERTLYQYEYQKSNVKSNVALAYFALGDQETAIQLWEQAANDHSHLEARFYPILLTVKNDPNAVTGKLKTNFSTFEMKELLNTMKDIISSSAGWFGNFAQEGFVILNSAINNRRMTFTPNQNSSNVVGNTAATGLTTIAGVSAAAKFHAKNIQEQNEAESAEVEADGEGPFDWLSGFSG